MFKGNTSDISRLNRIWSIHNIELLYAPSHSCFIRSLPHGVSSPARLPHSCLSDTRLDAATHRALSLPPASTGFTPSSLLSSSCRPCHATVAQEVSPVHTVSTSCNTQFVIQYQRHLIRDRQMTTTIRLFGRLVPLAKTKSAFRLVEI